MKRITTGVLILLAANGFATEQTHISGRIIDEAGLPIADVEVSLPDSLGRSLTNKQGIFELTVNKQPTYQLSIGKPGFYPVIQSFDDVELSRPIEQSNTIHPVTLVKKSKSRVMLAFTGDAMMGRRYYKPYFGDAVLINENQVLRDSKALLDVIKPYLSLADFSVVNLETQISQQQPANRAAKSVTFFSRPETLAALTWAGVDYVSLGNNHTYDYLDEGLASTLKHLDESGLGYSGAGTSQQAAIKPYQTKINDVSLAMLGFVGWQGSSKPTQTATAEHGGAAFGNMHNILSSVSEQAGKNHTTVVQYHGSHEYSDNPSGVTEQRLKSALDAGAALAVAHHPHVTQGLELYDGKLIAYSLGNFLFDQNFSATQLSYLLYVWLDDEKFHRAELVPVYVKGYKPTPATGSLRYAIMRRLSQLSNARGTSVGRSGNHGVIESTEHKTTKLDTEQAYTVEPVQSIADLSHLPWQKTIKSVQLPNGFKYRLGTNLVNGSDFEHFNTFNATERGWLFDRETTAIDNLGFRSNKSLALTIEPKQPSWFGMQSFRRVYLADQPTTVKLQLKTPEDIKLQVFWQGRKNRQKLFDAFENSPKNLIASHDVTGKKGWQTIEVDFNSVRIGHRSYRILLSLESNSASVSKVNIDDFAVIEWQNAFSESGAVRHIRNSERATYIGLNKASKQGITLILE